MKESYRGILMHEKKKNGVIEARGETKQSRECGRETNEKKTWQREKWNQWQLQTLYYRAKIKQYTLTAIMFHIDCLSFKTKLKINYVLNMKTNIKKITTN